MEEVGLFVNTAELVPMYGHRQTWEFPAAAPKQKWSKSSLCEEEERRRWSVSVYVSGSVQLDFYPLQMYHPPQLPPDNDTHFAADKERKRDDSTSFDLAISY